MLHLTKLRDLNLRVPVSPRRRAHLSAASGLRQVGNFLYVIADDEYHLGVFSTDHSVPGELIRLFPGELPDPKDERKRRKPDLEALCVLPAFKGFPSGALLALGSGSRANRRQGVLLGLDHAGAVQGVPRTIDLSGLYAVADKRFRELNIEGAVVLADRLRLFHRGNKGEGRNACLDFEFAAVIDALERGNSLDGVPLLDVRVHDLGDIAGVPFCFSDAAELAHGELIFTAIAEDTRDNYADGPCLGSAIGLLKRDGALQWLRRLEQPLKIEGVSARVEHNAIKLLLVTDDDRASIPAALYSTEIVR